MGTSLTLSGLPDSQALDYQQVGPTVLRILVGSQLRRLREASGISPKDAGEAIRASHSKISRLETGRTGFKIRDVTDLLNLYEVHDEAERAALLALARQANVPGWWHTYGDLCRTGSSLTSGWSRAPASSAVTRCSSSRACCRPRTTPAPSYNSAIPTPRRPRSNGGYTCGWNASGSSPGQIHRACGPSSMRPRFAGRSAAPPRCAVKSGTSSTSRPFPTSPSRWCRSAREATPPPEARSRFCASPKTRYPTWSI